MNAEVRRSVERSLAPLRALRERVPLCVRCLGRLFGAVGHGLDDAQRGAHVVAALGAGTATEPWECRWCRGAFLRMDRLVDRALQLLEGFEVRTFQVTSGKKGRVVALEEEIAAAGFAATMEPLRRDWNRTMGLRLAQARGWTHERFHPDVEVKVDPYKGRVRVIVRPLYVAGRYRKLRRGVSQTAWGRRSGASAEANEGEVRSVESILGAPLLRACGGTHAVLHAAGREDVDVRTLGRGRPFVLELNEPRVRSFELEAVEAALRGGGVVQGRELRFVGREEVARLKEGGWEKTYTVRIQLELARSAEEIARALEELGGGSIRQATPRRAERRRAAATRVRAVRFVRVLRLGERRWGLVLRAGSGLYVKELMHGDEGRTRPSLAELLGVPIAVESLDVRAIHDEFGVGPETFSRRRGTRELS